MKEVLLNDAIKAKEKLENVIKQECIKFSNNFGVPISKINFLHDDTGQYSTTNEYYIKIDILI